jgi:hypothetical protein
MANINDDTSVGRDSVFDWGSSGSSKVRLSSIEGKGTKTNINNAEAPSRYDPTAMSRIVDITDLVDDSDDDDDDNIIGSSSSMPHTMHIGTAGSKRSSSSSKKGLVGLIILAAIVCVVGFGYVNNQRSSSSTVSSAYLLVDDEDGQQEKLETAERVITACGSEGINKECQSLCKSKLCCFDDGEYGCQADDSKDCATYAGCIALVEGVAVGAADENEA